MCVSGGGGEGVGGQLLRRAPSRRSRGTLRYGTVGAPAPRPFNTHVPRVFTAPSPSWLLCFFWQGHYAPYDVPAEVWHLFSRFARGLDVADDRDNASYVPADPLVLQPSLRAGGAPRVRIADSALQAAGDGVGVPGPSGTVSLTGRRRRRRLQR